MATVLRENIGLLHDKLTVRVVKEDYFPAFEKSIREYSKKANIPGFRKGMVPAGMIKKMYGASVFNEEVIRTVEKELNEYLKNENPSIFAQPMPITPEHLHLDMNNPGEYDFDFEIGLKPEIEVAPLSTAKPTFYKVEVTEEMINEEINRMQIKAGNMTEPETIENPENVLTILFSESDNNGNIIENGISKENSVLLKYFSAKLQQELQGRKNGDHFVNQLSLCFEGKELEMILHDLGFAKDDKEAAEKYFLMVIKKIELVEKKPLNEEFFKEVYPGKEILTDEDFRIQLKTEIQQYWDNQSRNQLHDQLYHFLLDETKIDFPDDFLKRWMQKGGEKPKTENEAEVEYPSFSNSLKWTLISDKIARDNKIIPEPEELKDFVKADVMRYFGSISMDSEQNWLDSYVDRMMKDPKQIESAYHRLSAQKLFTWASNQVTPIEKTVTSEELSALQHDHQH